MKIGRFSQGGGPVNATRCAGGAGVSRETGHNPIWRESTPSLSEACSGHGYARFAHPYKYYRKSSKGVTLANRGPAVKDYPCEGLLQNPNQPKTVGLVRESLKPLTLVVGMLAGGFINERSAR